MYVYISFRLFTTTNALKTIAVPHDNNSILIRNTFIMLTGGLFTYFMCYAFMAIFVYRAM